MVNDNNEVKKNKIKKELISKIKAYAKENAEPGSLDDVFYKHFCHEYKDTGLRDTTSREVMVITHDLEDVYFFPSQNEWEYWDISAETMIVYCRYMEEDWSTIFGNYGYPNICPVFAELNDDSTDEEWFEKYDDNEKAVHEWIELPQNRKNLTDLCTEALELENEEGVSLADMSVEKLNYIAYWILNLE